MGKILKGCDCFFFLLLHFSSVLISHWSNEFRTKKAQYCYLFTRASNGTLLSLRYGIVLKKCHITDNFQRIF